MLQDVLKILHVAELDVAEYNATDVVKKYQAVVEAALVDAEVVLEQKLPGKTVAQQICAFVSASNAHYLVMGVDGMARFVDKVRCVFDALFRFKFNLCTLVCRVPAVRWVQVHLRV